MTLSETLGIMVVLWLVPVAATLFVAVGVRVALELEVLPGVRKGGA